MSVELRLESVERSCSKVLLDLLPRLWTVHVTLWSQFLSSPGAIGKTIYDTVLMSFFFKKNDGGGSGQQSNSFMVPS